MNDKSSGLGVVFGGCAVFAVLALVAGAFLFFGAARVSGPSTGPSMPITRGYAISGGAVSVNENGTRHATVRLTVDSGWELDEFEVREAVVITEGRKLPATVMTNLNEGPIAGVFDLTLEIPALPERLEEALDPMLKVEVTWRSSRGFFTKGNGSRGILFWIREDHLEERQ